MAAGMPDFGRGQASGIAARLGLDNLRRHDDGRTLLAAGAPIAVWAAAVLMALVLPLFLYSAFAGRLERLDARIADAAAAELAPLVRQRNIPRELVAAAAGLLERDALGLNYLTLRNADGVILLSNGRFEDLGGALPTAQARQFRGWLYRVSSDDRRLPLQHRGELVGYMDYGVDLRRALTAQPAWFWLVLLLWLVAVPAAVLRFGAAREALAGWREPLPPQPAPAPEPAAVSAPAARAASTRPAESGEEQWLRIANALGLGLVVADNLSRVRVINDTAGELLDRPAAMLRGRSVDDLAVFADDQGQERLSPLQRCLDGEAGPLRDILTVHGKRVSMAAGRWQRSRVHALLWAAGEEAGGGGDAPAAFAGTALWAHGDEAAALVDGEGVVRAANPALCLLLRRSEGELTGAPLSRVVPALGDVTPRQEGAVGGEAEIETGGDRLPVAYRLVALASAGAPTYLATLRPLPEQPGTAQPTSAETRAPVAADRDPLTGLPVRTALMDRIRQVWPGDGIAEAYALLVVDVVDFGRQNRSLGRDACDALLAAFAGRLAAVASDVADVARLGGDEFAVLQRLAGDAADADATARRVIEAFSEPVRSGDLELSMRVDIGLAVAPDDADSPQTLLQRAELALSAVQAAGDHVPRRYAPDMAEIASEAGPAAQALRRALARGTLALHLLPVWRGAGDAVVAGALARIAWDEPDGERHAGDALFTHAESLGLESELAAWYLRTLVETYADWRNIGLTPVPLLAPLPAAAARSPLLNDAWRAAVQRYRVPDAALVLLPPESGGQTAVAGPRVAGYGDADAADVLYLAPSRLAAEPDRTRALVAAARKRGIPVIAGPVEDDDQHVALQEAGIEYWYAADDALAPRAFGRLIARRGAKPL